jgi:hypothetical protein
MNKPDPKYAVVNETVDGENKVRITLGTETILLDIKQAYRLADGIRYLADLPATLAHINDIFDQAGWSGGDDGGTA